MKNVVITGITESSTTTTLTHGPSQSQIKTSAPKDNGGDGSLFSPTDLCVASLGSCGITIMNMFAKHNNIPVKSITFEAEKEMQKQPRKIQEIKITYKIFGDLTKEQFEKVVTAGKNCPVRLTLKDGTIINENFQQG